MKPILDPSKNLTSPKSDSATTHPGAGASRSRSYFLPISGNCHLVGLNLEPEPEAELPN